MSSLSKGSIVSLVGALAALILFTVGPWLYQTVGPLRLGFSTGLDFASQGKPLLYVVPIAAILAPALLFLLRGFLPERYGAICLVVVGLIPTAYLLYSLSDLKVFIGPFAIGELGWGFWATIIGLVLVAAGGLLNLAIDET
jgi:hypothetical protein